MSADATGELARARPRDKRWAVLFGSSGCLLLIVCVACVVVLFGEDIAMLATGRQRFDAEEWKRPGSSDWKDPVRQRMVDDLLAKHPLVGLDRTAVLDLVGPPTENPFSPGLLSRKRFAPDPLIYHLGPDHAWLDSEWLAVEFDAQGRVASAQLVTD